MEQFVCAHGVADPERNAVGNAEVEFGELAG